VFVECIYNRSSAAGNISSLNVDISTH